MIKAVTFDLWNTLIIEKDGTTARLQTLADSLNYKGYKYDTGELTKAYSAATKYYHYLWEVNHRHLTLRERSDIILSQLQINLPDAEKAKLSTAFSEVFLLDPPEFTSAALERVKAFSKKFKFGIISDTGITSGAVIRRFLENNKLLHHFSSTVFSDEIGICKPRKDVFKRATTELGVKPGEAVHVGDLLRTDVAGAKAFGMKAVWLNRYDIECIEGLEPDYIIHSLPELLDLSLFKVK